MSKRGAVGAQKRKTGRWARITTDKKERKPKHAWTEALNREMKKLTDLTDITTKKQITVESSQFPLVSSIFKSFKQKTKTQTDNSSVFAIPQVQVPSRLNCFPETHNDEPCIISEATSTLADEAAVVDKPSPDPAVLEKPSEG